MATIFETIEDLGKIITDAITAGNDENIPARSIRKTLIKVSTGQYREVLPIIVPAECCVMGDELRSVNVQPRKADNSTLTPKSDFPYSAKALERIEEIIGDVVDGIVVTPTEPVLLDENTNPVIQDTSWPYSEAIQVAEATETLVRNIRKTIDIKLGTKYDAELTPAYELDDPNFGYSRDLNILNKEFIQAEIIGYISEEYPNLKYSRTKCKQDVGFIIDAIAYDLTYGGNWQSVRAGEAYYEGTNFNISASEKQATLDAYAYLKALLQTVGRNITVTPVFQTEVEQIPGTGGTQTVSDEIASLMDDIIAIVDNGIGAITVTYPTQPSADQETDAFTALESALPEIQEKTIDFINKNFGSFKYDSAKFRQDLTNIMTDIAYDVALGTNYNAVFNSLVYLRPANAELLNTQRVETIGAIRNVRNEIRDLTDVSSSQTALDRSDAAFNKIVDVIRNGASAVDDINYVSPVGVVQDKVDAKDNIQANIEFIKADVIAWINNQIQQNTVVSPNPLSIWFEFEYDSAKCARDVEYILESLSYDILYGGTQAATRIAESYFDNGVTYPEGQVDQTVAAYGHLNDITQDIVQEIDVTPQSGNTELQTKLASPASATEAAEVDNNITIITDALSAGNLDSVPAVVFPDITWADQAIQDAKAEIDSSRNDIVVSTIQFITNTYSDFKYNHEKCSRDLGILAEAAGYDWMLDTNYATILAAYSYLRKPSAKVIGDQKDATIAANEFARTLIIQNVDNYYDAINTVNNSWEYINDVIWSASSEGNVRQVDFIENYNALRMLELNKEFIVEEAKAFVNDWFWNAVSQVETNNVSIADTSWLTPNQPVRFVNFDDSTAAAFEAGIIPDTPFFVKDIIDETTLTISETIGGPAFEFTPTQAAFIYDKQKCRRDTGLIVDGVSFDLVLGTNYNAVTNGLAYRRANASEVTGQQLTQTVDGINFARTLANTLRSVKLDVNALTRSNEAFNEILDILENGEGNADTLSFPAPPTASADTQNAVAQLIANRAFLQAEVLEFIDQNYPGLDYDSQKCERDVGYLVDALCYDVMYGTNTASIQAARSYFVGTVSQLGAGEKDATVAAYDYLASAAGFVVQEIESDVGTGFPLQAAVSQDTSGTAATSTEASIIEGLLQITENVINTESLVVIPDPVYPNITWADEGLQTAFYGMQNNKTDISIRTVRYLDKKYSALFRLEAAYDYNEALCSRDIREYIDAIKWDLVHPKQWDRSYTDNITVYLPGFYESKLAGRYYANSVIGSQEEDMYYLRNGTGLRLQTLDGLKGDLGPANEFGTSRPTAGAYASLDPGFGPDDTRVWISARSPYVQNVTTFGFAAVGQKIDGALHNGGNDSIVSNDFTQVISDGIGAWITNNGRAELVSVFTYYSHIGYLAETGGRIRATNGNNSYGTFGSVAEGVDPEETPVTAIVDNREQYNATVANVFTDQDQLLQLEYDHAGNEYTEATINIFGAGTSEEIIVDEFRDKAVNRVRVIETTPDTAGGEGYTIISNTAQTGTTTAIFLAATDGNVSSAYPGMAVYITGGAATGQYATIYTYNSGSKQAEVVRPASLIPTAAGSFVNETIYRIEEVGDTDWNSISEETLINPRPGTIFTATAAGSGTGTAIEMELGWEHVIPGTPITAPNASSTYVIEPRAHFSAPSKSITNVTSSEVTTTTDVTYFETSDQYTNVPAITNSDGQFATFDVTRIGEKYYLEINNPGEGYLRLDNLTIKGSLVGGADNLNDISITATTVNAETGAIVAFDFSGLAQKGLFISVGASSAASSIDGTTWSDVNLQTATTWNRIATGLLDDGSSLFKPSAAVAVANNGSISYSTDGETWNATTTPSASGGTLSIAFGNIAVGDNKFIVIDEASQDVFYSNDGGATWATFAGVLPGSGVTALTHGKGHFVAVVAGSQDVYFSRDAQTWSTGALTGSSNWKDIVWGNGRFVALHDTGIAYSYDLVDWYAVTLPVGGAPYTRIAYGQGIFVATQNSGDIAWSEDGTQWELFDVTPAAEDLTGGSIAFGNPAQDPRFIIIGTGTSVDVGILKIGARAKGRTSVANEQLFAIRLTEPGSGYDSDPTISIFDPNNIRDVELDVRRGNGVLANPTFVSRGSSFTTASAEIDSQTSNGFADFFQDGTFVAVRQLSQRPVNGSNVVFDSLPEQVFKLVNVVSFIGSQPGSFTAFLQISPEMTINDAPPNGDGVTLRIRYSQVRASSHDFLDIGTGNFVDTNYPGIPVNEPNQANETVESDGGRVFFTATDQDGNFRVGDLFSIEQATGVATLNAEAFNIAGLQELSLGEVTLGGNSASITEFSTDPFFTANSDNIVPTQRAVKAYIEAQIGGGGASLNVNSVTAGDIFINTNQITTVSGDVINIKANVNFQGNVLGLPLAYNYFLR